MAYDPEIILTSGPVSNLFKSLRLPNNQKNKTPKLNEVYKTPQKHKTKTSKYKQNVNQSSLFSGYK